MQGPHVRVKFQQATWPWISTWQLKYSKNCDNTDMHAWLIPLTICEKWVLKFRPQTHHKSSCVGRLIYFKPIWGGRGLIERGRLLNLEKTMVFVLHKEPVYKWKSSSTKRLEVVQPRIRVKSELPVGKYTIHPPSNFYNHDWFKYSLSFISEEYLDGGRGA